MIFKKKKRIIKHQYTIIELLVVLVIAGLLTGITVSGIKGALARQGATGAVRTLAAKVSLAQSFAVSKNRYVALLVPDYDKVNDYEAGVKDNDYGYKIVAQAAGTDVSTNWKGEYLSCFNKNRLCYITKISGVYTFDRWVPGYEWQTLPSKTIAFITEQSSGDTSTPIQVTDIPDPTDNDPNEKVTSTALVFKPSGALVNASQVVIRIFRAAYIPYEGNGGENVFRWQGTEDKNKGWKIVINGFTGRSRFCLGGEDI